MIIDLQSEFINNNTEWIIEKIDELRLSSQYDKKVFTKFVNNVGNPAYKIGWHGCMSEESRKLCIKPQAKDKVFEKTTYSACNERITKYLKENNIEKIFLCGLDIDCCILATAFNLFDAGYEVFILKDYVGCMQGDKLKKATLEILTRNLGSASII